MWYLKGRAAAGLEDLHEVLPQYSEKDFVIAQRMNAQGVWKSELWTNRDFEANEILLAPFLLAVERVSPRGVGPRSGEAPSTCLWSISSEWKLGPRWQNEDHHCKHMGSIDEEEHSGAWFWVVGRTSKASKCN